MDFSRLMNTVGRGCPVFRNGVMVIEFMTDAEPFFGEMEEDDAGHKNS